jgi:glycerophosphoryl diester phosphodiesterase
VENVEMTASERSEFVVIAHRGASGYLPEHTLEGAAFAHATGADYIEQDVVLTRDDQLIVLHDLHLDAVTDVAVRFPGRSRADGHHYAIDFSLAEIRTLAVRDRRDNGAPAFPGRFPDGGPAFRVPTLAEEIALIAGLNRSTGREVGLYVEPKAPAWHADEGKDLMAAVLGELARFGYEDAGDRVLLQSFDQAALRRARDELGSQLRMVQLIGENSWRESDTDFDRLRSAAGLREVAGYAQGIGPWLPQLLGPGEAAASGRPALLERAQELGLFVHAYTLRADQLQGYFATIEDATDYLLQIGLDGIFTDHPDRVATQAARWLDR